MFGLQQYGTDDMTDFSATDATTLCTIIAENEAWLIDRILFYALQQGYTRYTSTLREAWRQSIHGLSAPLLDALKNGIPDVELSPDEDYTKDPLTQFGILEAKRHRERGIGLGMFLGLMKYYRQCYMDLIRQKSPDSESRQRFYRILKRFFDRIEIGLVTTWHEPGENRQLTELQRANRTITNEKNKYLTIFQSIQSPIAVFNQDHRIDIANHAWAVFFGGSEIPGADYYAASQDNRPPAWLAVEVDRFITGGKTEEVKEKVVEAAGGKRHLNIRFKRMLDVSQKFSGCVTILDDVTLQKKAEAALKESTIWLTEMFNALEEAVFIGTPGGFIVKANKAVQRIFGYTPSELKNQRTELLHVDNDHYQAFTDRVRKALDAGKTASLEYVARRKNGEVFPASIDVALLKREDGSSLGLVSILRDITELKKAAEVTRKNERLTGVLELAGAVCHDLNQPLMALSGYAELIMMDGADKADYLPKLEKIVDQVTKMSAITKKLMRVTRYETKKYLDQQIIDIEKASEDPYGVDSGAF
jgi:PAS domain S-box-containing protein